MPSLADFFCILVETGFHHVVQAGLELLSSGSSPALASQSARITGVSHQIRPVLQIFTVKGYVMVWTDVTGRLINFWTLT